MKIYKKVPFKQGGQGGGAFLDPPEVKHWTCTWLYSTLNKAEPVH